MVAFDAQVIDALGKIEDVVAFEAEIIERVHPLAAGVEVTDFSCVASFADFHVPRTQARALETGTQHHVVLVQAAGFVGDDRAAPIQFRDGAPRVPVTHALLLLRNAVNAGLQRLPPAQTGIDQILFADDPWSLCAPDDNRFQLLGTHHSAQTVSGSVIVIVDEHGRTNEIFARRADAADARVRVAGLGAQHFFGFARSFTPDAPGVAQFDLVFADVKIHRLRRRAGNNQAIVTGRFERRSEVAAGGGAAEGVAGRGTEIDETRLRPAGRKTRAGDWTGHANDDVLCVVGVDVGWQLVEQDVFGE